MITFNYTCVTLEDFCKELGWDFERTNDMLLNSDISWGTNDDTLVMPTTLANICEMQLPENFNHDLMISLGS